MDDRQPAVPDPEAPEPEAPDPTAADPAPLKPTAADPTAPASPPAPAIPDGERQLVAVRLQEAVGAGTLALAEYIDRLDLAYAASTREELAQAIDGLPSARPVGRSRRTRYLVSIFGDEKRAGTWTPDNRVTAVNVFGDVTVDLRGAHVDGDEVTVRSWCLFGDVDVLVPEGVEVDLSGFCLFGDRTIDVAPVPRIPGTPRIRLVAVCLFGDAAIRSGEKPPSLWRRLTGKTDTGATPPAGGGI